MNRNFLLYFAVAALAAAGVRAADLAVVVHKDSALADVSSADLTKYFKGAKSKAPDGKKIVIIMQETGRPEREAALKGIFGMTEAAYADYFVEATFTGEVTAAPRALPSGLAVRKFVAETPGAVGYVQASEVDDSVKALLIDGKHPGDPGYKLTLK